jgi:hypothetical protein
MDDLERTFREGLRDAAAKKPPLGAIDLGDVTTRPVDAPPRRRPGRWLAVAAAVVLLAGIGAGAYALNGRGGVVPAVPAPASQAASPMATDAPSATTCKLTDVGSVLYPFRVSVRVVGDGRTGGLGKLTAFYLRANGFHVITYSEASSSNTATVTTIRGFATDSPEVRLVEKFFPGAVVEGDGRADHSVDVLVVGEPGQVNEPDANVPVSGALCLPAIPGEATDVPRPATVER